MVKLLDFGIAKETGKRRVVKGETTTTGQVLGSPHYMSPEQARGQPLDGRSDLWSLAVIMYRALTGKRPFDGDDIGDLIVRICTDPVPPPSSLRPELGRVVDHFFERAFNRDPDARFQSAKAFAAEFKAALATAQPRTAAPPSKPDAVGSPSWDSRDSSSFTSELSPPLDQDALTQLTPSPRHAPDPSHGAEAPLGSVPSSTVTAVETLSVSSTSRRSRAWLAGAAGVAAVAVIGAAVAMVGDESGGSQASDAASVALPEPSIEVASSAAASAADSARPAASATTAASAAPTASASAPRDPSPRPPRVVHPPPHPKTPPPPQVPDLGY
jgi:serine/threonine-protein kinase